MGLGRHEDDHVQSEDEADAEKQKLRTTEEEGMELQKIPVKVKDAEYPIIIQGITKNTFKTVSLKYALLGINGLIGLLGFVILCLSVWLRADPEFWEYENTLSLKDFYTVCYIFMFTGIVMILIAFVGTCGVTSENQILLMAYFIVFCCIFIIEFSGLVVLWAAPYSKSIGGRLDTQIKIQIQKRDHDSSSRGFIDFIQTNLECCGSQKPADFLIETPQSCQSIVTGNIHQTGCTEKMLLYLKTKAGIIGGIAIPILLFQLFGLFVSSCLLINIRRESSYEM